MQAPISARPWPTLVSTRFSSARPDEVARSSLTATGALKFTIHSPITERQPSFGFAVAAGKDLSGDGTPDFAIGAPLLNNLHGVVFIFSGIDGSLQRTLRSPDSQAFARFGASIFLSSDVTGDGRPDILVGAPEQNARGELKAGQVFIFRGNGSRF